MRKIAFLTFLCITSMSTFLSAQTIEEIAAIASDGLCECVNESYSNIDRDVKRAMVRIIKYQMDGKQDEMEEYANSLSVDLASRIEKQAALFQENDDLFQLCIDDLEVEVAEMNLEDEKYGNITEGAFLEMILAEMSDTKGCKFAYLLMELSFQEEEENNQVNIGQIKAKKQSSNESGENKFEGTGGN